MNNSVNRDGEKTCSSKERVRKWREKEAIRSTKGEGKRFHKVVTDQQAVITDSVTISLSTEFFWFSRNRSLVSILHSTLEHSTSQHSTIQYSIAQYSTA